MSRASKKVIVLRLQRSTMTGYYLLTSILVTTPGLSFPVKSDDDDVQRIGKAVIWTKILKFLDFLILKNFSRILEKFHFAISISSQFHFTFRSRSRS